MKRPAQIDCNNVSQLEYNVLMAKCTQSIKEISQEFEILETEVKKIFDKHKGLEIRGRPIF